MKNIIQNLVLDVLLILIVLVLSILVFWDEYVCVAPVVWVKRTGKLIVYSVIFCFLVLGIEIFYGAIFASKTSSLGSAIFLTTVAGLFIFNAFMAFHHREKIWSLA